MTPDHDPRQLPLVLGTETAEMRVLAAETLLMRASSMLYEWRVRRTLMASSMVTPGGTERLESDIAAFLADPALTFGPYPDAPIREVA